MSQFRLLAVVIAVNGIPTVHPADAADTPTTLPATAPAEWEARVWALLSDGDQRAAERIVNEQFHANPNDGHVNFMKALMTRSRFDVQGARTLFYNVKRYAPGSIESRVAIAVTQADDSFNESLKETGVKLLQQYSDQNPDNPAFAWLLAIACRQTDRNEQGVAAFERLAKHFKTGPSLFHQTFANLLDNLGRYDESLAHREQAVKLEPASWSYQGMGNTLRQMGRPADAIPIYKKALALRPNDFLCLNQMCGCAVLVKDKDTLIPAAKKLVEIRPNWADSYVYVAMGLSMQGDNNAAATQMKKAFTYDTNNADLAKATVNMLRLAGRNEEADALFNEWNRRAALPGSRSKPLEP